MSDLVIQMRELTRSYVMGAETVNALRGVTLEIRRNEYVAIMGPSGSGKSTMMNMVGCLDTPTSGEYWLNGQEVSRMPDDALARVRNREIGFVFQTFNLLPRASALQNVELPLVYAGVSSRIRRQRAETALTRVGLGNRMDHRPNELSGGQRQRVSLARALSAGPSLLVADEPTSALDVSVQAAVLNLIGRLQTDLGFACLFITHDLAAVEFLAQRVAVMYLGVLVEVAERGGLFAAPRHPYTQALLSAAPIPDPQLQRARRRIVLPGEVPSPIDPPSGCRFHPRCPVAVAECAHVVPSLRPVGRSGELVACHLVGDDGTGPTLT